MEQIQEFLSIDEGSVRVLPEQEVILEPMGPEEPEPGGLLPVIVEEDETKREACAKHFRCDDGSYLAVAYPAPVHQKRDGAWVEMDYPLTAEAQRIESLAQDAYVSLAADNEAVAADGLVRMAAGPYGLQWNVEAMAASKRSSGIRRQVSIARSAGARIQSAAEGPRGGKADPAAAVLEKKREAQKALETSAPAAAAEEAAIASGRGTFSEAGALLTEETNRMIAAYNRARILNVSFGSAAVAYPNALDEGISLRYQLSPGRVKEAVILEKPGCLLSYSNRMRAEGLQAVLEADGSVLYRNEAGETIFTVAAPHMYDAVAAVSRDIAVSLRKEGAESVVTYTLPVAWLSAPERVFPVVIDPEVTTKGQSNQTDNYIYDGQEAVINKNEPHLYVGWYPQDGEKKEHRAFWRAGALPTIPGGSAMIQSAQFHIRLSDSTSTMGKIGVYRVLSPWSDSTLSWCSKPEVSDVLATVSTVPSGVPKRLSYSVTSTVRGWYSGTVPNYGLAIGYTEYADDHNQFFSADYGSGNISYIPYLTVNYKVPAQCIQVPAAAQVYVGRSISLTAVLVPEDAANQNITWVSCCPDIAAVSGSGRTVQISGLKKGTAEIRATANESGCTASCMVTVKKGVTGVEISLSAASMNVNGSGELVATVLPRDADDRSVTWQSDNPDIAAISTGSAVISTGSNVGSVAAISAGTTTLRVRTNDGGFTKTCQLTVLPHTDTDTETVPYWTYLSTTEEV